MMNRRDLLRYGLGAAGTLTGSALASASTEEARSGTKVPRYVVSMLLSGGMDAILTTDPKTRADVERWVDLPYDSRKIVSSKGLTLGPLARGLAPHASKVALLNGIQTHSANHNTGIEQFRCLRALATPRMPSWLDIVGEHRSGQPIGHMTQRWLLPGFVPELSRDRPERQSRFEILARVLRQHATAQRRASSSVDSQRVAQGYEEAAALIAKTPVRSEPEKSTEEDIYEALFDRTLWALEHDLTRAISLDLGGRDQPWDTHNFNLDLQTVMTEGFFDLFDRFLRGLEERKNRHGSLASNTLIVVGSEIGRFPRLNDSKGKDHLPQIPMLFLGPVVNTSNGNGSQFGATSRRMEAVPISARTGRADDHGHRPELDEVGRTLLEMCGVPNPGVYGYRAGRLDFLVNA